MIFLLHLATLFWSATGVLADRNVTVDDFDKRIDYLPTIDVWLVEKNRFVLDRMGQTIHYTNHVGASATFSFNNTKILHYFGYGISEITPAPFPITLFDGEEVQSFTADAHTEPDEETSALIWTSPELDPAKVYQFTVTKTADSRNFDMNVDAFILVQPDEPVLISTGSSTDLTVPSGSDITPQPTGSGEGSGVKMPVGAIIGTTLGGLAFILIFAYFVIRHFSQKRSQPQQERLTIETPWSIPPQPTTLSSSSGLPPGAGVLASGGPARSTWKPPLTTFVNHSSSTSGNLPTTATTHSNPIISPGSDGFPDTNSNPSTNGDGWGRFSEIHTVRSPPPAYPAV